MTLAQLPRFNEYAADGVTTEFAIKFQFFDTTDIVVYFRDSDGVETIQSAGFTIAGGDGATGSCTFEAAPAAAVGTVGVRARTPIDQQTKYPNGGNFPSEAAERGYDRGIAIDQEQQDQLDDHAARALMVPPGETAAPLPPASQRRGGHKVIGADPNTGALGVIDLDDNFKGDPGGSLYNVGPLSAAIAMDIRAAAPGADIVALTDRPGRWGYRTAEPEVGSLYSTYFKDNGGSWWELVADDAVVDARSAGMTGEGDETSKLQHLADWAQTYNVPAIALPFETVTVLDGTEIYGRRLIGNDTDLIGYTRGARSYENIRLNGANQSDQQLDPEYPLRDQRPKILWRETENYHFVAVEKTDPSKGYVLMSFRNNSTTTNESIADVTDQQTRFRLVGVDDAVFVGLCQKTYSDSSGTWTHTQASGSTVFANRIPPCTSGRAMQYWQASQNGDSLTFTTKARNGKVNVAFLCGTSTDGTVDVQINGGTAVSVSAQATISNTIKVFTFDVGEGDDGDDVTVKLTKQGSNGVSVFVIGVNWFELKDWDGTPADHYFYYRNVYDADTNTTGRVSYLTMGSANDFVIRDFGAHTYGTSYHGGETDIVSEWYADNAVVYSLDADITSFVPTKNLELRGSCSVDWTALEGGTSSIDVESLIFFGAGGLGIHTLAHGTIEAEELYTTMGGWTEDFSELVEPVYADFADYSDSDRIVAGRTNRTALRNPATGQKITSIFSLFANEENHYGGPSFRKVVGSYHKLYYGPVMEGRRSYGSISSTSIHLFE